MIRPASLTLGFIAVLLVGGSSGCGEEPADDDGAINDTALITDSDTKPDTDSDVDYDLPIRPEEIIVSGTTYYVDSTRGNDANDGVSRETAFKTLNFARWALSPQGGDKLVLKGTFKDTLRMWNINEGMNPDKPTVIQCDFDEDGNPLPAVIDGGIRKEDFPFDKNGLDDGFGEGLGNYLNFGVYVDNVNYITISGLTIRGIVGRGVWLNKVNHSVVEWMDIGHTSNNAIRIHNDTNLRTDPQCVDAIIRYNRTNHTNLGFWENKPDTGWQNPDTRSETITVSGIDGFDVHNNHLSNTFKEGIDYKFGSRNGKIRNNLIENTRSAAIYSNEGRETDIYQNYIRNVGWYDPEDGTGPMLVDEYQRIIWDGIYWEVHGTAILIGNGDLALASRETGQVFDVRVFENLITWTLKAAISVTNRWENEGKTGWLMDDIHVFNNTTYKTNQGAILGNYPNNSAAIPVVNTLTNCSVQNNITTHSPQYGVNVNSLDEVDMDAYYESNAISHNMWHENTGEWPKYYGSDMLFEDPLFKSEPSEIGSPGDFKLQEGSPAIGAGTDVGLGTPIDMGAFQYGEKPWTAGIPLEGND